MTSKPKLFDKLEMEICLSNLISLSEITNRCSKEHREALLNLNANAHFLQKVNDFNALFSEFAEKLSVKQ